MRKILAGLAILAAFASPAHAQKTKVQITTEIGTLFPDNVVGAITPLALRTVALDTVNSIMPTAPVTAGNLACFSGTTGLLQDCGVFPGSAPLIVGTTPITNGTTTRVLFNNGGVLGQYPISGSVSVCMTVSCVMTTPSLGAAVGSSIALNGCTIGANIFCVTGATSLGATIVTTLNGLTVSNSAGTLTIPNNASAVLQMTGNFTLNLTAAGASTPTFPSGTHTLVGQDTTDTLTNKTFNSTDVGNVLQVGGVTVFKGQFPGTATNDSATAGNIGEYVESVIASGAATSLTTGTPKTITSISLTAGDWDVSGNISFITVAGTSVTGTFSSISGTTNTMDATAGKQAGGFWAAIVPGASTPAFSTPVGPYRLSLSGTTTVFLVAQGFFTANTLTGYGIIRARRAR